MWEKMRRELGLGEPSDRDGAGGADEGLGGVGAHPASLAGRAPGQAVGARRVPETGSPGQSCRTQATETARGRWPWHRLRDGSQTAALASRSVTATNSAEPRLWRHVGI